MSIAAKMAKSGYMPKARNKKNESREFDFKTGEDRQESKAADEEKDTGLLQGPSATDKAASAMWLKSRLKNKSKVEVRLPGTTNSEISSMTGSRYGTGGSLPYKMPENIMSPSKEAQKKSQLGPSIPKDSDSKSQEEKAKIEVAPSDNSNKQVSRYSDKREFMQFIRGSRFAAKPNRLVRQCVHCCILYSTSHVCRGSGAPVDLDEK